MNQELTTIAQVHGRRREQVEEKGREQHRDSKCKTYSTEEENLIDDNSRGTEEHRNNSHKFDC